MAKSKKKTKDVIEQEKINQDENMIRIESVEPEEIPTEIEETIELKPETDKIELADTDSSDVLVPESNGEDAEVIFDEVKLDEQDYETNKDVALTPESSDEVETNKDELIEEPKTENKNKRVKLGRGFDFSWNGTYYN